jgi:hypothetical protein
VAATTGGSNDSDGRGHRQLKTKRWFKRIFILVLSGNDTILKGAVSEQYEKDPYL